MSNKTRSLRGSLEALLPGTVKDPQRVLLTVARELYAGLDTPISLGLDILLRYGELEQVVRKRVNPLDYNDPLKFRLDYQAVNFLAKAPLEISGVDPQAEAVQSFLKAEEACKQTNHRIRTYRDSPEQLGPLFHSILHAAVKIISQTLGPVNSEELLSKCRFGPGGDSTTSANRTSAYDKLLTKPEATRDAIPLACAIVNETHGLQCAFGRDPYWGPQREFAETDFGHVKGNRITFVPKTAVTHRTIAIEPHLNIYMQLGVGAMLRSRLRKRGLDLDSQEGNQYLALQGSKTGGLCTIDLSAASDTVSRELVRELIPEPWYMLMDQIRSKHGLLHEDGKQLAVVSYEKFSSMGNGFTFELETLIFWALAKAVLQHLGISEHDEDGIPTFRVYGDDIVVPFAAYHTLVDVLTWCGFTTNDRKSFYSGYFRESCGSDYFGGTPVRPFFQKELPNDVQALFRMANGLRRTAHRSASHLGCDNRYRAATDQAIRHLAKPFRSFKQPAFQRVSSYENHPKEAGCSEAYSYALLGTSYHGVENGWPRAVDFARSHTGSPAGCDRLPGLSEQEGFIGIRHGEICAEGQTTRTEDRPSEVARMGSSTIRFPILRPGETWVRGSRYKETPSAEEQALKGYCETDDSLALIGNQDEALGSKYCKLKRDSQLQRTAHVTMGVRARPLGFEWSASEGNIFGVLLYETRNGREIATSSRSTSRGLGRRYVVWLHWEQWRDMGPWV